jgi:hypothetical protein
MIALCSKSLVCVLRVRWKNLKTIYGSLPLRVKNCEMVAQHRLQRTASGIDIRSRKFWEDSLAVIGQKIERYCKL